MIRARFAAEGQTPDVDDVKRYQREELGSLSDDMALLELLPLPVRNRSNTSRWPYAGLGGETLSSREKYVGHYEEPRRRQLLHMTENERPLAVITYGDAVWRQHLGAHDTVNKKAWTTCHATTTIVCTHHPEGARANRHWQEIGEFIRRASRST